MTVPRARQIIDRAAEERTRFVQFVRGVPEEQWRNLSPKGIWQARDYVAHLASVDPLVTVWFRAYQSREGGSTPGPQLSIDDWNEEQILARREASIDALLDEMARNRVDLNAALADFTDEQLDRSVHFGGDNKRAPREVQVFLFLTGWALHDRWHMEDARRAIAGEAEQPFGDEAFAAAMRERAARQP